jgi:hypothetical protein
MRVAEIWRFPVKSLGGELLTHADVDELGITGDRQWGLYDPVGDKVLTARREPQLLFLSARLDDGEPVITNVGGDVLDGDDAVSKALGRRVELVGADAGTATFENPLDVEHETDWMEWQSSNGTLHDGRSKISFVNRSSLRDWDPRRFRLNVIFDGADDERDLDGDVRVGTAVVSIRKPIARCIMVTRPQPGLDRDVSVLKQIIAERDNELGIGGVVTTPGRIAVGDQITPA